ncbi:signal peptidase II [Labrys monachus]|uniref:Lipoprotein signal peptidase n=1 Tax=Labrys monachus TaxID=217067 RepID=A0ABU0FLQ5_9HYPH|nr:signal peptidase II [Labrys monachus]MDQ0394980.1 signal peptidase II [Labrys monachus]
MPAPFQGRSLTLGLAVAVLSAIADQVHKYWSLHVFDIANNGPLDWTPFLRIVLVWNRGVSYGLFQQNSEFGRWALISFRLFAVLLLVVWLARITSRTGAVAIGLIIGGAIGNGIDGVLYGAVADFFLFHVGTFEWYVFNVADIAIVAGVALLLYDVVLNKDPGTTRS